MRRPLPITIGIVFWGCFSHAAVGQSSNTPSQAAQEQHPQTITNTQGLLSAGAETETNTHALINRGGAFYRKRDFQNAAIAFSQATRLEPTNYEANLYLGYSYYYLSDFRSAIVAFKAASASRPSESAPHYWEALSLRILNRHSEAISALKTSLALNTNQPRAWMELGFCQYRTRANQDAADSLQQCLSIEPTNALAHLWLGYALVRLGKPAAAATAFEQAAKFQPHDFDANFWHGLTLMRLQRYREATPSLEEALKARPADRTVRWLLLGDYLVVGQYQKIPQLHLRLGLLTWIPMLGLYFPVTGLLLWKTLRQKPTPAPGLVFALAWCGVIAMGQTVFALIAFTLSWPMSLALGLGLTLSALPLLVGAHFGFARQPWGQPFGWRQSMPSRKLVFVSFGLLVGIFLFDGGYTWLVERIMGDKVPEQIVTGWLRGGANEGLWLWLTFIAVGLLAPITEEILFCGLLFGAIRKRLSEPWTIVVTAVLFAAVHIQPIFFLPMVLVGILLGWARSRSGGLVLPVLIHVLNNSVALVAMFSSGR